MATETNQRKEIDLPAGRIRYHEAGSGKPVVFVHGYLVDGRLWDGVVDRLSDRFRCIAPDWPMGAQQIAMNRDADLSLPASPRRSPPCSKRSSSRTSRSSATTPAARCRRSWPPATPSGSAAWC
jgi:pimeloyl-ACP methyl ester carboxylesterase